MLGWESPYLTLDTFQVPIEDTQRNLHLGVPLHCPVLDYCILAGQVLDWFSTSFEGNQGWTADM